jgi:hypothetical protein
MHEEDCEKFCVLLIKSELYEARENNFPNGGVSKIKFIDHLSPFCPKL